MGAPASPSGSRASTEPSSTVSALTGFDPSRKGGVFSNPFADKLARLLILELASGKGTVRSLGVLYGMLLGAARTEDDWANAFVPINRAILDHFGDGPFGKLDRIKMAAWDFHDRAASAIEARSDATGTGAAEGESATGEAGDAPQVPA